MKIGLIIALVAAGLTACTSGSVVREAVAYKIATGRSPMRPLVANALMGSTPRGGMFDTDFNRTASNTGLGSGNVKRNAYGAGIGMDQYGRPVRHDPLLHIAPNAYGLGVGMDQYGRPVH